MPAPSVTFIPAGCPTVADRDGDLYDLNADGLYRDRNTDGAYHLATLAAAYGPLRDATNDKENV